MTYTDLKLLATVAHDNYSGKPHSILVKGFTAAARRLRAKGFITIDKTNVRKVRITPAGVNFCESLVDFIDQAHGE